MLLSLEGYEDGMVRQALGMLLVDRKNEFRELAEVLFWNIPPSMNPIPNWEYFVINFSLDVSQEFRIWSGKVKMLQNSDLKALTILRQLSRDQSSMNQVTHLLNIAFDLAEEFKIIYRRLK